MKNNGFTLIELLVVIAIIGLLASIVLVSLNSARSKARDARRLADARQIRAALEMYYDKYGGYPYYPYPSCIYSTSSNFLQELVSGGFLGQVPTDPLNTDDPRYRYEYCAPITYPCGNVVLFQVRMESKDPQDDTGSCGDWSGNMWYESTWPW